jgi:hypothetical protein
LHFVEDGDPAWWIDKLLAVHSSQALLDGVLLFEFMEPNHTFFPDSIVILKLLLVALDDCIIERIVLLMLLLVPFLILLFVVYK